ncbi:MAG TPA: hypothetical protein DCE33_16075, partial [Rhodospirillaceae bacterium]|nr:hypothetical protein [Rhodospirillaceae bacterium]
MVSNFGFVDCAFRAPHGDHGAGAHDHGHRREVVVNGTRVKTIDIHAHCAVPEAMAVIDQSPGIDELLMDDTTTRIAAMDAQGLDMAALSINPYWYHADRDAAAEV